MDNLKLKDRLNSKMQTVEERNNDMDKMDLATTSNYAALTNNALDIIRDNLKKQPLSFQLFDIVKSPSGGSTVFSVPGLSGDEAAKELTGIISITPHPAHTGILPILWRELRLPVSARTA